MKFSDMGLHPKVLEALIPLGYEQPTPIQEQAIPHVLNGRDVMGIAQTGTWAKPPRSPPIGAPPRAQHDAWPRRATGLGFDPHP